MPAIAFFEQDISFKPPKPLKTKRWIRRILEAERKRLLQLNFIFCSDAYLLSINEQYLRHKSLTDIITFDHSEGNNRVEGDIFISVERVAENAKTLKIGFDEELHRVMIHGVLHLLGYRDKTAVEKTRMRKKEDACLSLRFH